MNNKEIYQKTLTFSIRRLLWDMASLAVIILLAAAGFFLAEKLANAGLIGLAIGVVVGIIAVAIVSHFISYVFKAGQIAMMTEGIATGKLPADVYATGKKSSKSALLLWPPTMLSPALSKVFSMKLVAHLLPLGRLLAAIMVAPSAVQFLASSRL